MVMITYIKKIPCLLINDLKEVHNKQMEENQNIRLINKAMIENAYLIIKIKMMINYVENIFAH